MSSKNPIPSARQRARSQLTGKTRTLSENGPQRGRPPTIRHRNLPMVLLQVRELVLAHFRPTLNEAGLTEQQWRILRVLLDAGPLEPHAIGTACRISSPSLAGVLGRMDDLGLVHRKRLLSDQRRIRVALTAKSRALASALAPRIEAIYASIEARLGDQFMNRFQASLDEFIVRMRAPSEPNKS
jgi:homoprotocatechuate degradation regulator HpaR